MQSRRFLTVILLTVLFFSAMWFVSSYFSVKSIQFQGIDSLQGIDSVNHSFLPFIHTGRLTNKLQTLNPTLASLTVQKMYPQTLVVTARKQRPAVELVLSDGSATLSESGMVLAKEKSDQNDSQLPKITYYQPLYYNQLSVGETIEYKEILAGSYFAQKVLELGTSVTTIDITNENMIVLQAESYTVIVTSEEDIELQSARLNYTYTELQRKKKKFSSIDVRFERPIITLQK